MPGVIGRYTLKKGLVGLVPVMLVHPIDAAVQIHTLITLNSLSFLGGACFGPKPRDFSYTLPLKIRWLAFRSALSEKYRQGQVSVVSSASLQFESLKTSEAAAKLFGFARPETKDRPRKMLILGTEPDNSPALRNFLLATRNLDGAEIKYLQVNQPQLIKDRYKLKQHEKHPVTAYHLVKYHHVCITPEAIDFYAQLNQ